MKNLTPESFLHRIIRHYKGNYYFVEEVSTDSETLEPVLIYRPLYPSEHKIYNRPFRMFIEAIDPKKPDNLTGQATRFEIVGEEFYRDYRGKIAK